MANDKQPNFRERIEALEIAAKQLDEIAALIISEAEHMEAAAKRYADRRAEKRKARE
jgi:hypothetical protein